MHALLDDSPARDAGTCMPADGDTLPEAASVRLSVFDVLGREVAVLVAGPQSAGRHTVTWSADALPSGLYLYRLEAGSFVETRTMTLAK